MTDMHRSRGVVALLLPFSLLSCGDAPASAPPPQAPTTPVASAVAPAAPVELTVGVVVSERRPISLVELSRLPMTVGMVGDDLGALGADWKARIASGAAIKAAQGKRARLESEVAECKKSSCTELAKKQKALADATAAVAAAKKDYESRTTALLTKLKDASGKPGAKPGVQLAFALVFAERMRDKDADEKAIAKVSTVALTMAESKSTLDTPVGWYVRYHLGHAYLDAGETEKARSEWEPLAKVAIADAPEGPAEVAFRVAQLYFDGRDYLQAAEWYGLSEKQARAGGMISLWARYGGMWAGLKARKFDDAARLGVDVLDVSAKREDRLRDMEIDAFKVVAAASMRLPISDSARLPSDKYLAAAVALELAHTYLRRHRLDEATARWEKILAAYPETFPAVRACASLAKAYEATGNPKAKETYDRCSTQFSLESEWGHRHGVRRDKDGFPTESDLVAETIFAAFDDEIATARDPLPAKRMNALVSGCVSDYFAGWEGLDAHPGELDVTIDAGITKASLSSTMAKDSATAWAPVLTCIEADGHTLFGADTPATHASVRVTPSGRP
ncbi:MAG: tetratricopeptide repeat protein [Polyangiales bacterium]